MDKRYIHDCDNCKFLGTYKHYDLYVCARNNTADTVIARFGDEPHEYKSGIGFSFGQIPELTRARVLTLKLGYKLKSYEYDIQYTVCDSRRLRIFLGITLRGKNQPSWIANMNYAFGTYKEIEKQRIKAFTSGY